MFQKINEFAVERRGRPITNTQTNWSGPITKGDAPMSYIHTYIHIFIHKFIHKFIHTYIHTYTLTISPSSDVSCSRRSVISWVFLTP